MPWHSKLGIDHLPKYYYGARTESRIRSLHWWSPQGKGKSASAQIELRVKGAVQIAKRSPHWMVSPPAIHLQATSLAPSRRIQPLCEPGRGMGGFHFDLPYPSRQQHKPPLHMKTCFRPSLPSGWHIEAICHTTSFPNRFTSVITRSNTSRL